MNLREIIEAATPGPWLFAADAKTVFVGTRPNGVWRNVHAAPITAHLSQHDKDQRKANATFIATFNPELVGLLLSVKEAADKMLDSQWYDADFDCYRYKHEQDLEDALAALEEHHIGRGLS
jgi:hypothetical protein